MLCATISAVISNPALDWPDGAKCNIHGRVGYGTREDEPEDTLVPRLIAAGAIMQNVAIWTLDQPPEPRDLEGLTLLIVSPLVEILPDGKDANSERDARQFIKPWKAKAKEIGCTVVAIVHYNKKNDLAAVQQILGSVGLPNALRNTWCVERDDEDTTLRLFMLNSGHIPQDSVLSRHSTLSSVSLRIACLIYIVGESTLSQIPDGCPHQSTLVDHLSPLRHIAISM